MSKSVSVRGWDFNTSDDAIREAFEAIGPIEEFTKKGRAKAIITFYTDTDAEEAVSALNGSVLPGNKRYIDVELEGGSTGGSNKKAGQMRPAAAPADEYEDVEVEEEGSSSKVSLRGLDFAIKVDDIESHCSQYGVVTKVDMGKRKGQAVVEYADPSDADLAVKALAGSVIPGYQRYLEVRKGGLKSKTTQWHGKAERTDDVPAKGSVAAYRPAPTKRAAPASTPGSPACAVFVRGFDFEVTEQELTDHCSQCGFVEHVDMKRGNAVVTFASPYEAQSAVESLDKSILPGFKRYIDVKLKKQTSEGTAEPEAKRQKVGAYVAPSRSPGAQQFGAARPKPAVVPTNPNMRQFKESMAECWRLYCHATPSYSGMQSVDGFLDGLPPHAKKSLGIPEY